MSQRSIEVKVGALILVAVGLLGAFIIVMGGVNFQPTYTVFVDFDNPGGLQGGSPVKIAGVKVGKIVELQYRGGEVNPETGQREPLVRAKASIEKRYQAGLRDNSTFYVTTQGVLGEQFMQIDPGSADRPLLDDGDIVRGLDPPRLDMLLSESYELLHTGVKALRENREQLAETFDGLRATLKGTGDFFDKNKDRLDAIAENVEKITEDVEHLVKTAQTNYVDNPKILAVIDRVDETTRILQRDAEPMMKDAREAIASANRVAALFAAPEQQAQIKGTLSDVAEIASRAKSATVEAEAIVTHVKKGRGSVGALVMDEQMYDDLQELLRDLKHNPWKFFWRQ